MLVQRFLYEVVVHVVLGVDDWLAVELPRLLRESNAEGLERAAKIAMLEANLGVAIAPVSTRRSERLRSLPINGLDVKRTVAIYSVAGRQRSHVATMLLNLLRAADWSPYVH